MGPGPRLRHLRTEPHDLDRRLRDPRLPSSIVARALSPTRAAISTRLPPQPSLTLSLIPEACQSSQFGMGRTVRARQLRTLEQECAATCIILQELNVLLIRTLYVEQASIIAAVVCSLIVAGLLKGMIGVGMPVVALPLLSLFIDIKSAAMLLSMPLILSNLPQALEGGKTGRCLVQLMPVLLGTIPGVFLGVRILLALDADAARTIAGLVLMGAGGITLFAPELQIRSRLVLPTGIAFGFFGGILGGIAAMAGPLVFI